MSRQLRPYQQEAVEAVYRQWADGIDRTAVVLPTGTGKAIAADTPIQTPDGLRRFGDIAVGDRVFGRDGAPTEVTAVYEQGVRPVYRITFSDRTSVVVDGEHLWRVSRRRKRLPRVLTTAQLMATDLRDAEGWRWRIPMAAAVERPPAQLPVPPYTLGALIANGYLHGRGAPELTTPDRDVAALIKAEHVAMVDRFRPDQCEAYSLPGLQDAIRAMGLAVPSGQKFIPRAYLEGSVDQRVALLRGLMDADGSSRTGGRRSVNYHTTSERLARDVQELVWSLGGTATCNTYDRTAEGKPVEYTLSILTPPWLHPFATLRKQQDEHPRRVFAPRRAIVSIEPEGVAPVRCIRVDATDHLFLIGREYIVTHNTDVIAALAVREARAGRRVLALAHRDELLNQITERIGMHDPDIPIGRVQAQHRTHRRPIVVASTPTLWRAKRRDQMARPDVVLYDEVHHAPSEKSVEVLRWAGVYGQGAKLCGFTATPIRGDRRGMGDVLQAVAFKRDIAWAVGQGYLVRPRGKVVVADHMDLNNAKVRAGDYTDGELGDMVEQDVDQIVAAWLEYAADRLTIAFTPNVASAQALTEAFHAAGVSAEVVLGSTPTDERELIYKRLACGQTRVLVGVAVMTEGWDCPPVSCVLQCRPTRSPGLYTQMVGRALRPCPEVGKTDALVLDVVGASRHQKLVTLVDLSVSADYDTTAIDDLPCDVCGRWPSRAAARRQGEPDAEVCQCEGDGAGESNRRRLEGPAIYEDLDLLLSSSPFTWQQTYGGTPFLSAGEDRMAVLWLDRKTDLYIVGHCRKRGLALDGVRLGAGLTLDEARKVAEEWALAYSAGQLDTSSRKAGWRRGAPSERQIALARAYRIPHPERMSKAELSDAINVAMASSMLDRRAA